MQSKRNAGSVLYFPKEMENDRLARLNTLSDMTYTYPDNGTRPHAVTSAGGSTYTYDYNGNMTRGAGRSITYNHENMPLTITANGITTNIDYDGFGERIQKTTGPNTTVYISGLYECANGNCTKYIFANGQRIAAKTTSNIYYYHPDHLGSSSVITASSGLNVENLAYYPFGQTMIDSGSTNVPYKYTGQELDAETGLYNYNARLYDPVLGRFITADSIIPDPGDPQSFNRYSYTLNNPVNYIDPTGHWSIKIGGTKISGDDKTLAGVVVAATAVATWYCGGCGAGIGALAGEGAGWYHAEQTGGNVLQEVAIGGVIGGTLGYYGGQYLADPQYAMVADGLNKTAAAPTWTLSLSDKATLGLLGAGGSYMAFSAIGGGRDGGGGSSISADRGNSYYTPTAPQFVDVHQNMLEAEKHQGNLPWFYNQVRNKGPWDYKQAGSLYGKFGNFNYGATGRALGVPADVLLRGAGWAHQQAGNMGSGGSWWGSAPYGDDKNDQLMIKMGIEYYNIWKGLR